MSFNNKLIDLLKTNHSFVNDDDELLLAAVQDHAWKLDHDLIKLLLSDKEIKDTFFDEIEKHWIFNVNTFLDFISHKNFLDNSYTRFKNRIGLTIDGKYLRERGEVALVWPYKDTVLEGGQTKEEEKRHEIFFNEVLAQDEINQLLDPKVLTNFTRYTAKAKEKVKEFKRDENGVIRENLILKGNNLLALHTLTEQFRGQVKLIYIDPPYNTGNDSFGYNDNFNHSTWLTFMKNRLEVAKTLLSDDGMIFVQCDDNEFAYLKIIMDEIFERDNFVTSICVQMSYVSGEKMAHVNKKPPKIKEFLLFYSKDKAQIEITPQYTESNIGKEYNKFIVKTGKDYRTWKVVPITQVLKEKGLNTEEEIEEFMIKNADLIFNRVRNKSNLFLDTRNVAHLVPLVTPTGLKKWAWHGREAIFLSERLAESQDGSIAFQQALGDIWSDLPIVNLYLEGDVKLIGGKKPEKLISRIIEMTTKLGDLVLDYHLGTGTTCAVAHKLGRQYIGVEQIDYGKDGSTVRLENVIKGDQSGISEEVNWKSGGDFIYCELMKYNEAFIERIQAAKTSKELLKIWQEMAEGSFLNWYVNPEMPEEALKDFEALGKEENGLKKQKHLLAALLDKNQLYVNYSEIDDTLFKVSKEDKELNKTFYGEA